MRKTSQSVNGTSFFRDRVAATVAELRKVCGEPTNVNNYGHDKVNFQWEMETDAGKPFTIYDWKEYRPLGENEMIEWHIGGHSGSVTVDAAAELINSLKTLRNESK